MWIIVKLTFLVASALLLVVQLNKTDEINYETRITENGKPPRKTIVFLKTLKCASSTVVNILHRFAKAHNLKVAVPAGRGTHFGGIDAFFDPSLVRNVHLQPFDMLFFHTRLDKQKIMKIMKPRPFFFTILRNPFRQFVSYYNYVGTSRTIDIHKFFANPAFFYSGLPDDRLRNPMAYMLGFNSRANYTRGDISRFVEKVLAQFDVIMISDYFDMSLLVLRKHCHWSLDDLISFTINSQKLEKPDRNLERDILEWNDVDYALYQSALSRLWADIYRISREQVDSDLAYIEARRTQLYSQCVESESRNDAKINKSSKTYKELTYGFVLSDFGRGNELCQKLVMSDLGISLSYN